MELTKHGHACVTLEHQGRQLVIDPGGLTSEEVFARADAVLITHEHFDHYRGDTLADAMLANPALEVWTNKSVAETFDGDPARVHVVGDGDAFTANGFDVRAYGQWHAELHPDIPRVMNVGFLVDGAVFHPGDAFTVPDVPVSTLLLPVHGPWSRLADLIDWVREVKPKQTFAVHDGALNPVGLAMLGTFLTENGPAPTGAPYTHLAPGESRLLT